MERQTKRHRCSHLRVIGGPQFPTQRGYSAGFVDLIQSMLTVDPKTRPNVDECLAKVEQLLK